MKTTPTAYIKDSETRAVAYSSRDELLLELGMWEIFERVILGGKGFVLRLLGGRHGKFWGWMRLHGDSLLTPGG